MKSRIILQLIPKTGIFPKYLENIPNCTATFRRDTPNSLLCVNVLQHRLNLRKSSTWAPNEVKSRIMDYPIAEGTLVEQIWSRLDQWSEKVALVCGVTDRVMTYNELREQSKRVATFLLNDLGLTPGQIIAVILPNMPEYGPLILGIFEAGLIATTINPAYTVDEITTQLKDSCAVAAVTFPDKLSTLMDAVKSLDKSDFRIVATPNIDGSSLKELPNGVISYSELISDKVDTKLLKSLKVKKVSPNDTVVIPYSSGTTGKPKGVCLTHRNLLANNANMRYVRHVWDTTSHHQDVIPLVLPIFHTYALTVIFAHALYCGAKIVLLPKFEEPIFLKSLKHYKATILYLAPPLVLYIANNPSVTKEHLSSVRTTVCGAAPLAESDILRFLEKCPKDLSFNQGALDIFS